MLNIYSSDDIEEVHAGLEQARKTSRIPNIEFARALLQYAEEIVRDEAKKHKAADRPLHEPDFVRLAETIAGIVDHTNPRLQNRGLTGCHEELQEMRALTQPLLDRKDGALPFETADDALTFEEDGFSVQILLSKEKLGQLIINGQFKGGGSLALMMRRAKMAHDAHLVTKVGSQFFDLPADTDCYDGNIIAKIGTSAGEYAVSVDEEVYTVSLDGKPVRQADHTGDAVAFIKQDYLSRCLQD